MSELHIHLSFGKRSLRTCLSAAMLLAAVTESGSESVNMTTYYPAPSGVYAQMITTGNTYLARDSGTVEIGTSVLNPAYKLDVNGPVNMGQTSVTGLSDGGSAAIGGSASIGGTATMQGLTVTGSAVSMPKAMLSVQGLTAVGPAVVGSLAVDGTNAVWQQINIPAIPAIDFASGFGAWTTDGSPPPTNNLCGGTYDASPGGYVCPPGVTQTCNDVQVQGANVQSYGAVDGPYWQADGYLGGFFGNVPCSAWNPNFCGPNNSSDNCPGNDQTNWYVCQPGVNVNCWDYDNSGASYTYARNVVCSWQQWRQQIVNCSASVPAMSTWLLSAPPGVAP